MNSIIAVTVEDVLAQPAETVLAAAPRAEGLMLLRALAPSYGVLYLTIHEDTDAVKSWLGRQGAPEDMKVLGPDEEGSRTTQLAELRLRGRHVEFLITSTPETLKHAQALGIPTLCYVIPPPEIRWARPAPQPPTAWEEVLSELDAVVVPSGGEEDGTRIL